MVWTAHKLIYRAKSPVHVGCYTLGYINLTRPYIPGRSMWGAATALLTRSHGTVDKYADFGIFLKTNVLFSYFYPSIDKAEPLLPHHTEDGIMYGCYPESEFQKLFIGARTQTAVDPDSNTATDESLHESEYIRNKIVTNNNDGTSDAKDVFFVGYIFIKGGILLDGKTVFWDSGDINLKETVKEIFIGGDIKYGWGRLELCEDTGSPVETIFNACLEQQSTNESDKPVISLRTGDPIPAHLCLQSNKDVKGDIEPLVGRNWQAVKEGPIHEGAGQKISGMGYYWVPGSVLDKDKQLRIGEYGILS